MEGQNIAGIFTLIWCDPNLTTRRYRTCNSEYSVKKQIISPDLFQQCQALREKETVEMFYVKRDPRVMKTKNNLSKHFRDEFKNV